MNGQTFVLYHASCQDGWGAAWSAHTVLGDGATYIPVQYGQPVPEIPDGAIVYVLDFSWPRADLEALAARTTLRVLDHHKTARDELAGLSYATFDMDKSGAVLAWEYFRPGNPVPTLLLYVQDRDLWRWQLPRSREINAALMVEDRDFRHWSVLADDMEDWTEDWHSDDFADLGEAILKAQSQHVTSLCNKAFFTDVGGYRVPAVNSPLFQSEIGDELCKRHPDAPFSASFFVPEPGVEVWSLRSRNGFDVSQVAKALGGGGHAAAAGFRRAVPQ